MQGFNCEAAKEGEIAVLALDPAKLCERVSEQRSACVHVLQT